MDYALESTCVNPSNNQVRDAIRDLTRLWCQLFGLTDGYEMLIVNKISNKFDEHKVFESAPNRTRTCAPGLGIPRSIHLSYGGNVPDRT